VYIIKSREREWYGTRRPKFALTASISDCDIGGCGEFWSLCSLWCPTDLMWNDLLSLNVSNNVGWFIVYRIFCYLFQAPVPEKEETFEFPVPYLYELENRVFTESWSIPYKREESLGRCLLAAIKLAQEGFELCFAWS